MTENDHLHIVSTPSGQMELVNDKAPRRESNSINAQNSSIRDEIVEDEKQTNSESHGIEHDSALQDFSVQQADDLFKQDKPSDMTWGRRLARFLSDQFPWYNPISHSRTQDKGVGISPPSLDEAWAYFEHSQLPRRKVDTMPKNDANSNTTGLGLVAQHIRRLRRSGSKDCFQKADYGEQGEKTELYSVLRTPEAVLAEFGISVGIYFWTLRMLAYITLAAGLLSVPNMVYFSSTAYNSNVSTVKPGLLGSAVCSDSEWVPCPTCQRSDWNTFPETFSRFATSEGGLSFILRNKCNVRLAEGSFAMAVLVFVCISICIVIVVSRRREINLDQGVQTTSDYSLAVMNPPADAYNPDEWKEFFSKFDDAQVAVVTVAVDNEELIRTLEKRRKIIQKMRYLVQPGVQFDPKNLDAMVPMCLSVPKWKEYFLLQKSAQQLLSNIKKIDSVATTLARKAMSVSCVFISFESEVSQRHVLNLLSMSGLQRLLAKDALGDDLKFRGKHTLHVVEPVEPSSVRWHNLDETLMTKVFRAGISFTVSSALILFGAFLVYEAGQKSPVWASLTVTAINQVTPRLCKMISNLFESHSSDGSYQASLYIKMTIFKWVNTAIVTASITPFVFTTAPGDTKLINKVYAVFFAELLVNPLLLVSDLWGHIQRHILGPREVDQERMNLRFRGGTFLVSLRYTEMTKILFLTFFYSAIFPTGFFFAAASLTANYLADKFCLLRTYGPAPEVGNDVARMSRRFFFTSALAVFALMISYNFAGFPFDNACNTSEAVPADYVGTFSLVDGDGQAVSTISVDAEQSAYTYCLQDMFNFRNPVAFPALPRFQRDGMNWMTADQEIVTQMLGWASVVVIFLVSFVVIGSMIMLILRNFVFRRTRPTSNLSIQRFSGMKQRSGYIPGIKSPSFQYPLLACNVSELDPELLDWNDPNSSFPFDEHNLINDIPNLTTDTDNMIFSAIKSYYNCRGAPD